MTKIREGYKETEIGIIPGDWKVVTLLDISNNKGEYGIGSKAVDYIEGRPRYLRITDIDDFSRLIDSGYKTIAEDDYKNYILEKDDLVFARTGNTTGKTYLYNEKDGVLVFAGFLIKFSINSNKMYSNFVKQFCQTKYYWDWVRQSSTRSGQPGINSKQYGELKLPQPTLIEQKSIAEILLTTDEHIEKLDKTIKDYQLLKEGMMKKLLTEGIGHTEFKDTEIGRIPKEWEVRELGEVGEIVTGNTPKTAEPENYGFEYCWVSPSDLGKSKYITNTNIKLSLTGFNKTRKLPRGSVLVTCIGSTIGKIGVLGEEYGSTNQQINSIICNDSTDSEFVYYSIKHNFNRYTPYISTQAIPIINKTVFSKFKIQLPTLQEQQYITKILSNIDNRIELYESEKQDFIQLKKALMEKLITGKIRTI